MTIIFQYVNTDWCDRLNHDLSSIYSPVTVPWKYKLPANI